MNNERAAIVLAAGKGTRMRSDRAKVLHEIAGKPIIDHVITTLLDTGIKRIVVVIGHQGDDVREYLRGAFPEVSIEFCWQRQQKGTGHAVMVAKDALAGFDGAVVVTAGDVPFISEKTLNSLFADHESNSASATCLSAVFSDATGYGRAVRDGDSDRLLKIVEHKDASAEILRINEINSGIFAFSSRELFSALDAVTTDNSQGEYYLTDVISILNQQGKPCFVSRAENPDEVRGINSVEQLQELERMFR
jgi:UDP-N-acetylglucosamine diphosphorylase/glucosamine-1-phosphate N-acetyltransferase